MAATIEEMQDLVVKLGDSGVNIPGLDTDTVIEGMLERDPKFKELFDSMDSENSEDSAEEKKKKREEKREELKKTLKTHGRTFIDEQIATIKLSYSSLLSGMDQIKAMIATIAPMNLLPSVIAVPVVVPNPASIVLSLKEKKNSLLNILNNLIQVFMQMLQAAINISFPLPNSVINVGEALNTIKNTVNLIP